MKIIRLLSVFTSSILVLFSGSVLSAYQYTYTSQPFQYVENDFTRGHIFNISEDSFLKVVITSQIPLETWDLETLSTATYDFTVEGFTDRARPDGTYGNQFYASDLLIQQIGDDGLPTRWYLNLTKTITLPNDGTTSIGYYTDDFFTQFGYSETFNGVTQRIYAAGGVGSWELSQISSPVPEPQARVLFLSGLGLMAFVSRRRKP